MIIDRLTKTTTFFSIKMTHMLDRLAQLYVNKIVSQQGAIVSIESNRDLGFTFMLWPSLQIVLGTKLYFSTTLHSQMDGQLEGTMRHWTIC